MDRITEFHFILDITLSWILAKIQDYLIVGTFTKKNSIQQLNISGLFKSIQFSYLV